MSSGLILGAIFVGVLTWGISWAVTRWAAHEQAQQDAERKRLDTIMRANCPPKAAGWPSKRVG